MSGKLGVLILDTRFPRLPGDPGNPATYKVPAILRRVEKATAACLEGWRERFNTNDRLGLTY
jgi:hypothetical protein